MSDQPLTLIVLAQFHRQVILPDIERVVGTAVQGCERRLRDEMHTLHDFVLTRLDRLETEYEAIKAGLGRLEARVERMEARVEQIDERLGRIEMRMEAAETQLLDLQTRLGRIEGRLEELVALEDKYPVRAEVQDLKARVALLHEGIGRLEQRLKG